MLLEEEEGKRRAKKASMPMPNKFRQIPSAVSCLRSVAHACHARSLARAFRYSHGASADIEGREGAGSSRSINIAPLFLTPSFRALPPPPPLPPLPSSSSSAPLRSCIQISDPFSPPPPPAPSFPCTPLQGPPKQQHVGSRRISLSSKKVPNTYDL